MKNKNHNIRFNMEKGDECRAWELLHSPQIRQMFKSQNKFVIEAVNDYYERHMAVKNDPYMETREKEDAFAERIVGTVEKKVMSNLPALFGMYMAQMQAFSLPWIVNTFLDNFFKVVLPVLYRGFISQGGMYPVIIIPVYIIP